MLHWKPGGGLAPDRSRKNEGTFRYPPFAPTYTPFHLHRSRNPRCFCLEVRKLQILVLCINTILAQRGSWTWRPFFWGFHNLQGNVRSPNHGFCWAKNKWGKKNMVQAKRNSRLVGDESSSLLVFLDGLTLFCLLASTFLATGFKRFSKVVSFCFIFSHYHGPFQYHWPIWFSHFVVPY